MQERLSNDFIAELVKYCLSNKKVLEVCKKHLKFHYLVTEAQKKVVKYIFEIDDIQHTVPTIGAIGQTFSTEQEVISFLSRVKAVKVENNQVDTLLDTLEVYIKETRFQILYQKIGDLYNEGKKQKAIELLAKESPEIVRFTLKDTYYTTIFKDFDARLNERQRADADGSNIILKDKLTFGIHALDDITMGGFNKGTSVLIVAQSGAGKSTCMRWIALCNARLGRRVVHFQAEGSEQECLEAYDAGWTSINLNDIEFGRVSESKKVEIKKAQRDILGAGGEIYVYASETFDSMSINDAREILLDITTVYGQVDLVVFDYLELFTVKGQYGSSEASERKRREDIANKITNIAVEFKCGVVTATQTQDIPKDKTNNPDFVITRTHISEFKNVIKPFSYVVTLNQTEDEYETNIMRIYVDKLRKYKARQTIRFYQSRLNSRFYNAAKNIQEGLVKI